jgi:hypothetical protein
MTDVSHGINAHAFHGAPWIREEGERLLVVEFDGGLNDPRFVTVDYDTLLQNCRE